MRHVEHVHIMALVDVHGYMCVEIKQLLKRIKVSVQLLFSQIIIFVFYVWDKAYYAICDS